MLTAYEYTKLDKEQWRSDTINDCCSTDNPDNPSGGCCYDSWYTELLEVNTTYSEAEEQARQILAQYNLIAIRRDKLKGWYDELTKLDEIARKICHHLEIFINQVIKIEKNTGLAIKAIHILYCMIRDFYVQIDYIKTRYDQLMNCIKCIDSPALATGVGIMKCLEDYYKKLDAIIKTRDVMIIQIISALKIANLIHANFSEEYGLKAMIDAWRFTFNCDEECGSNTAEARHQQHDHEQKPQSDCEEVCVLDPMLTFPICNDPYYNEISDKYHDDDNKAKELARELLEKNKRKEELLACKQSLTAAIAEVDPKTRCN